MDNIVHGAELLLTFALITLLMRNWTGTVAVEKIGFKNYTQFAKGLQSF